MVVLPKGLTIFAYVKQWRFEVCENCDVPIDVLWHPGQQDSEAQWAPDYFFLRHCPECIDEACPLQIRQTLSKRYRRLRADRWSVGLGDGARGVGRFPVFPSVREALRWPENQPITLHALTQRGVGKRTGELYLQRCVIIGEIGESLTGYIDSNSIRKYPWFNLKSPTYHRPGEHVGAAAIQIGSSARDPQHPYLELQELLRWHNPGSPDPLRIRGRQFYPPQEIGAFVTKAMTLFEESRISGAPPGIRNRHKYARRLVEISQHLGYKPSRTEFRINFHKFQDEDVDVPVELADKTLRTFLAGRTYDQWADSVLDDNHPDS